MSETARRFVTQEDVQVDESPSVRCEWLCRPGLVDVDQLQLVRAIMPAGKSHEFHRHPDCEEIIYVLEGQAEQWVETERRTLGPGDVAHIPKGVVHATYNRSERPLAFLAILSPATGQGPESIDVYSEEPWSSLRS